MPPPGKAWKNRNHPLIDRLSAEPLTWLMDSRWLKWGRNESDFCGCLGLPGERLLTMPLYCHEYDYVEPYLYIYINLGLKVRREGGHHISLVVQAEGGEKFGLK